MKDNKKQIRRREPEERTILHYCPNCGIRTDIVDVSYTIAKAPEITIINATITEQTK